MKTSLYAVVATLAVTSSPALAEDTPPVRNHADTSFSVGEIIVTAKGMAGSSSNVLSSLDRMGGDKAQSASVDNVYELIGQMPGVQVTDFNQGTTSGKFSFRAFNGEGGINAVKLLVDGVPSNSNDGNMPYIDMVFPLNIETIEVVRGTSDPRYGLHNIAGNANIVTRSGGTFLDARAELGSYSTHDGQLVAGIERGALAQNYQIAWRESGGFRKHGDMDRLSLSGKWTLALGGKITLGAIARYYKANAQEPGYLIFADARADPRMTNAYNVSDGDRRRIQQYALKLDVSFSDQLDWSSLAYVNRLRDDRYVKFSASASQQRRVTNEDHWGASSALHYHGTIGSMPVMLEAGGNMEMQDNRSMRWLSVERVPTRQTRDQQYDLDVGGVYFQAIVEPAPWLRITPAYRIDWVGGNFANRLAGTTAPINHYGAIRQPKLSVAILPTDGVTIYGNWGKTFQIGVGSGSYLIPPRQVDLAPSVNEGWEAGVKYALGSRLEARLAYWEQSATGEIKRKLNDPLGDFENVGATDRKGVDLQLSAKPVKGVSLWGAVSWQKAVIRTPDPATPTLGGNDIDHTPRWLWSGGIDVTPVERVRLSLSMRGQSGYHLDSTNAQGRFGQLFVLDGAVSWQLTDQVDLGLAVRNLTNGHDEYVWWDGAQSLHSPANDTNVTASVRLRL